jgi:hypothetical protein
MNAVNDALAVVGAPAVSAPATPEKLWRALRAASSAGTASVLSAISPA